ncbi:MAG TPA: hypothetical protein VFJ74_15025 [Gemmatimonadaceae bacterium]|nr:hypothetical protein [Gemmatimonadaceae bacterium]
MLHTPRLREPGLRLLVQLLAALLALVAATLALPAPLAAQQQLVAGPAAARPAVFEGYFSRVHADPAVVGERLRIDGMGARVLQPLAAPAGAPQRSSFLDRLAVGGFVTYAPDVDRGLTAWHYGAQADVSLLRQPAAGGVVEPLFSLGVGAFRTQRSSTGTIDAAAVRADCAMPLRPADAPLLLGQRFGAASCGDATGSGPALGTHLALSPALAARAWLLPNVAVRADAREVIVYDGAPRHAFEVTTGLSFTR